MVIGIDASRANRKFKGGTEWYSYYLIRELAKIDSTNKYILYSDEPLIDGLLDLTRDGSEFKLVSFKRGCRQIKSPYNNFKAKILNWPLVYFWTQIRLSWEMFLCPPDVLFIPAHTLPVVHPKKSVVTIHDIGFERDQQLYSSDSIGPGGGWSGKIINFLVKLFTGGKFGTSVLDYHSWSTKFALKHARKIIAVSQFTKRELMAVYGPASTKIEVVYNGFNAALYQPVDDKNLVEKVLNSHGIKTPYIFYVGRLEKKKNIARLIQAFALMKAQYKNLNHKLVLVGKASLGFDEINYMIEEFDLNDEVVITGWLPEQDLPYLYSGASLFVFPSLYEGFGLPLLQAMALGVPIAASKTASIPEITAGAALLFNPQDEYDMAAKIAKVLLDKQLAAGLVNQGRARVKDFSLAKCAEKTLAVLEKM